MEKINEGSNGMLQTSAQALVSKPIANTFMSLFKDIKVSVQRHCCPDIVVLSVEGTTAL